jgi:hypothetical protein
MFFVAFEQKADVSLALTPVGYRLFAVPGRQQWA